MKIRLFTKIFYKRRMIDDHQPIHSVTRGYKKRIATFVKRLNDRYPQQVSIL